MKLETSSDDHEILIIEINGQQSDPLEPDPPAVREHIEKVRRKYIEAGLIKPPPPKPDGTQE